MVSFAHADADIKRLCSGVIGAIGCVVGWLSLFTAGFLIGIVVWSGNVLFMAWDWGMEKSGRKRVIYDRQNSSSPYLVRYYLLFKDRHGYVPFNLFLHKFLKSDGDSVHDHPWDYATMILRGGYREYVLDKADNSIVAHWRGPGFCQFVRAEHAHRVELAGSSGTEPCWTFFVAFRRKRIWGFYDDKAEWRPEDEHLGQAKLGGPDKETQTEADDGDLSESVTAEPDAGEPAEDYGGATKTTSSMWFLGSVAPAKKTL